jgi:siderophore synthetase component
MISSMMLMIGQMQAEQAEEKAFYKMLNSLPFEEQSKMLDARKIERDKRERYWIEERRHQELCRSIRSVSFWRFGS